MTDPITAAVAGKGAELLIGSAAEGLHQMVERLGLLDRLKSKLMKQPGVALDKLNTVVLEMDKIFTRLSSEIQAYSALTLLPPEDQVKGISHAKAIEIWQRDCMKLRSYAAGDHVTPMRHGHGDCQKISWIYATYLNPWFADVLTPEESDELQRLFRELSESDSYMMDALMQTANWLQHEAQGTEALIRHEDYEAAQRRVDAVWHQWTPVMNDLHLSSQRLWDLQAAFIKTRNPLRG